jgi:hypothetical protein
MSVGKLDETAGSMLGGIRVHRSARSREDLIARTDLQLAAMLNTPQCTKQHRQTQESFFSNNNAIGSYDGARKDVSH